ncbi:solute carrier family 25 member 43 [Brienomyrus brachyistius]|uniref:solute carrier family 25 member 43 n=1 Tax=Brienomyrus brachyistius TaxID=42636 RepID=UPI0020B40FF0|nr:solute carrier family 25 member 43 [Brienomyrus brachyistius]
MATVRRDDRLTGLQGFMCVGFAGIFSKTATAPLEVVKILNQVGSFHCRAGFVHSFARVSCSEGFRALWKGNLVSCLRLFPYSAVHLAAYRKLINLHMDEVGCISQWRAICAGSLAGIVAALVSYPLEVAETRLVVQNMRDPTYRGALHVLSSVYRHEGLCALYRGFSLTVIGAVPFSLGCYMVYVNLDWLWQEPSFRFTPLQNFISGCLAAGLAQTLSFPFETVKRKMQAQSALLPQAGSVDVHFSGMLDCFRQTVRSNGFLSLWNGLAANTAKIIPYFGLLFTCFEACKQVCLYHNGYIVSPLSFQPAPGVDQSLGPNELQEVQRYLSNRGFSSPQNNMDDRW